MAGVKGGRHSNPQRLLFMRDINLDWHRSYGLTCEQNYAATVFVCAKMTENVVIADVYGDRFDLPGLGDCNDAWTMGSDHGS